MLRSAHRKSVAGISSDDAQMPSLTTFKPADAGAIGKHTVTCTFEIADLRRRHKGDADGMQQRTRMV